MRPLRLSFVAAALACLSTSTAAEEPAGTNRCGGEVPSQLAVPAGNRLAFALEAKGVQVYACAANGASFGWALQHPDATLSEPSGREAGTHYAGPTWESVDGSKVVGAKLEAVTQDAAAVPWLLLRASSHGGSGRMSDVSYVQRVRTSGGNAPARDCDATHAGAVARVSYRALYCFYRGDAGRR